MTDEPTNDPSTDPTEPVGIPAEPVTDVGGEGPPPWQAPAAPTAAVADPASTPPGPPERPARSGVVVPIWALVTVAGLLVFGLGLLGGWAIASRDDDSHEAFSPRDLRELVPFAPNGGTANGRDADRWDNGNGSGNGDSNGNGSGSTQNANVYLGVVPKDSSDPSGAEVTEVAPSSPAEKAGLEDGDVITAVDGDAVHSASQLVTRVRSHEAGDKVSVTYVRDGDSKTVDVTLAARPPISQLPLPDQTPQSES